MAIEICSVATRFHGVVLRQGILCRDRQWPMSKDLGCNKVNSIATDEAKVRGNHVVIEPFYVATEFWPSLEGFLSRQNILSRDRVWPRQKGFVSR